MRDSPRHARRTRRARDAGIAVRIDLPSHHRAGRADVLAASTRSSRRLLTVKQIAYSRAAVRTLARMPRNLADRIRARIRACADDPASQAGNVRRLRGPGRFLRLRVGDWRVVMRDADTLEILHIATRGHADRD